MTSRLLAGVAFVCCALGAAFAQNPTVVEPKHYLLQFQNEHVEVVYIHYGPHEKSSIHDHPGGVVVNLSGGHLRLTDENGKVQEIYGKAGDARWFPPLRHRVENIGETAYNGIYIGIKERASAASHEQSVPQEAEVQKIIAEALTESGKTK